LIGDLGMLLGEAGINIASMSNGRNQPGETAITVVNVDQTVPPTVLERVRRLRHVRDANFVELSADNSTHLPL
jgi:D-3-phosphoglycerate dehydrogenase